MKVIINNIKDNCELDNIQDRYFSEINIGETFKFCCKYINAENIKFSSQELIIKSLKFINSVEVEGRKLIICGYINAGFFIDEIKECFYVKRKVPFNTCIVVPYDTADEEVVNLNYCIEDMTIVNLECNFVFLSITLFLEYIKNETNLKIINGVD